MPIQSPEVDLKQVGTCPYLGCRDDRETALSYPSPQNCCFHAKPISQVGFAYQRKYCLTISFTGCPVYKSELIGSLPKGIQGLLPGKSKIKPWMAILSVFLLILSVTIASVFFGFITIPGYQPMQLIGHETQTPIVGIIPSVMMTPTVPTITSTPELLPTQTDEPVVPTPIQPHLLETPIGYNPILLLHRVNPGEGFIYLADTYNTSVEAIKAVNLNMVDLIYANQVIVIPVDTTDVNGLPGFLVYEILEEGKTIEDIAYELVVDITSLIKYNDLVAGYQLTVGEWLLIPR
jgi:hypothetical protein